MQGQKEQLRTDLDTYDDFREQGSRKNGHKAKWLLRFLAPLKLLTYENIYWLWIPMIIFSFLGIWISFLNLEFLKPFIDGSFYCTFITIMCPYVLEFFVELKVKKRSNVKQKFTFYKITSVVAAFCHIVISGLILDKPISQILWFEIIYIVLSIAITLYVYLVFKMDNHPEYLREFMDGTYAEKETENVNELIVEASSVTETTVKGRKIDI